MIIIFKNLIVMLSMINFYYVSIKKIIISNKFENDLTKIFQISNLLFINCNEKKRN